MSGGWKPLWFAVEPALRSAQPKRLRWPKPGKGGWIGPVCSPLREDRSPSFSVLPDSESNPGAWKDFATGEHGSMRELARRLGIGRETLEGTGGAPVIEPERTLAEFCRRRRLDRETLEREWNVREVRYSGRPALRFPTSCGVDRIKFLDGRKPKAGWAGKGGRQHWYGLPGALKIDPGELILANGEPSVWACQQSGVAAACLCAGEGTPPTSEMIEELRHSGIRHVHVVYDLDEPGRKGARAAVRALRSGGLEAAALRLPDDLGLGGDLDDLHRRAGDDGLAEALEGLQELSGSVEVSEDVPALGVMRSYRRPAPAFPLILLGAWAPWAENAAEGTGSPIDYVACGLLALAAGAIGSAARVMPWPGWREPCVLWVGLIGDPSSGKSPSLDPLLAAAARLERSWVEPWEAEHKQWREAEVVAAEHHSAWQKTVRRAVKAGEPAPVRPAAAEPPPEPARPRLRVADTTPEALAAVLAGNPRGVIVVRDELSAWLGGMGRYHNGAAASERALWIEAYGARPHVVDRASKGVVTIDHLAVSILGTTQPQRLDRLLLAGDDDGLASRLLWTWPEPIPPRRPARSADVGCLTRGLRWLRELPMPAGQDSGPEPLILALSPEAVPLFEEWRADHHRASRSAAGFTASAAGKAPGLVLRLALVLELLEAAAAEVAVPDTVSARALAAGVALWADYFGPMAERVLGDAALPEIDRDAAVLSKWIAATKPEVVNARNLRRETRLPGLTSANRVTAALGALVEAAWLEPAPSRAGGTAGRRRSDYRVRPEVYRMLDEARHD